MEKLVSICLATYNGSQYLKEQLDSLCNQTYQNIEILIQDDASSDTTVDLIQTYRMHHNIQLFVNDTNLGYIKNFETLIQKAKGEYIALCDQDDIWNENKIELLVKSIGTHSLIYSNSLLIDSNGNSLQKTLQEKLKNNFIDSKEPLNFLFDNSVSAHAALFKKELLSTIFPFPKHIYFDAWIALNAANTNGVTYYDKNLVLYRQHSTNTLGNIKKDKSSAISKISNKADKKEKNVQLILSKIDELLQMKNLSNNDQMILKELQRLYLQFTTKYFNFTLFFFLLKNKELFFKITNKSSLYIAFKHAIGKKLYKVAPFL
ncbi:glycosyltransferase family 2 protein [Sulfurimonas sp. C5]|uniref:glycosyltransferase family 2 protein n=1 Tax=Sulfurimonas sp. C5 TaxID=3036947 RepID=UPI00245850CD|nr:glycosyltransferase family 2 protein [Sulfurimonas sp. C5]MDH4945461.1 glycosyltransferase family 2 protein [Sulfurimonas sp. C5]